MEKEILKNENEKLNEIKLVIDDIIKSNKKQISSEDRQIEEIRKYMVDNIELDNELGDIDIDALRNGEKVQVLKSNIDLLEVKNDKLTKIRNSPFFGRFDICDDYGEEKYYVGLQNVQKKEKLFVIDWRAPICSLYYDSPIGSTSYNVNGRNFQVNLMLKRQFELENGVIINYYDINDSLNDSYLNKILQGNTSNYMSNIVKSIQEEQNGIIRLPLSNSVILQGVAGSGKTSIAMHRIAYLLYSNANVNHQNILFISPSTLFSAYISHLLPELGEENVLCCSFVDVLSENRLLDFNPLKRAELLENILVGNKNLQKQIEKTYSVEYFDSLCNFLSEQICVKDFANMFSKAPQTLVEKLFYVGEDSYNLRSRIIFIAERFANYFGYKKVKTAILTRKILQYFENKFNTDLLFEKFMQEQNLNIDKLQNISTYVFIKMCVEGFNEDKDIKHIVIDEMQDYDFLSYKILTMLYPKATFTILGDIHQNLLTQTPNSLIKLQEIIKNATLEKLEISYRSTANIFAYANKIIGEEPPKRIIRQGEEPEEIVCANTEKLLKVIDEKTKKAKNKHQKIAILCQTSKEAQELASLLPNFDILVSDTAVTSLESSAIISTIYLCKGLEFDSVIIPISKSEFKKPDNKHLLYVAVTRALHNVTICLI